jgi:collagenase-like PrtC family protease
MKLSLGPLLYYWSREDTLAFYEAAAGWPVDTIYLGETVCSRRHLLRAQDWFDLADRLSAAGKEVVLSTQTLIESESDLKALRKIVDWANVARSSLPACESGRGPLIEANDFGAVSLCAKSGLPFVAGPSLNVYNPDTLALLAESGARRWVPPVEMPKAMLASMPVPAGMETEVFGYGRLPLAFSARCFTARHYNLQKDDCQFKCLDHPDGLAMRTREGTDFLTLNGIQTQSGNVHNLAHRLAELAELGVDRLRLSPQSRHMAQVVAAFHALLDGTQPPADVTARLTHLIPGQPCDGYWLGRAGHDYQPAQPA